MASGPFQPLHPMSQGHLFSVIHFFGKVSFPICSPWALVPALKIYEVCTGTSFQLLLFFFLRISKISRQIKAFSIWYVQMLLLFQVCFFLLLAGEWKDVCLSVLGGGTLLIKAKIDCAGSGCFEAQCPSGSLATGTQAWCSSLGSFFPCLLPCLPDRVQSLWIEDTWLARTNDEQQHELWVWVPPNKWEEVFVCQVSHTSEHQALCCVRRALCQHSASCLTSGIGSVYSQY